MSNGTLARGKTTSDHPEERRAKLKRGRMSESAELEQWQIDALDALPADANEAAVAAACQGKSKTTAKQMRVKYPEETRKAYERALALTGTPEKGGPKYPLTVKQADTMKRALDSRAKGTAELHAALGKVSDAALAKIAKGKDAPKDATATVRAFLKAHGGLRDDRTMYARKGAALVLAWRQPK